MYDKLPPLKLMVPEAGGVTTVSVEGSTAGPPVIRLSTLKLSTGGWAAVFEEVWVPVAYAPVPLRHRQGRVVGVVVRR